VQQLRGIIRRETRSVMREMAAERAAIREGNITQLQTRRSLTEAVAMGFYGPGFGDSRAPVLWSHTGSRMGWFLNENEEPGVSAGAVKDALGDMTLKQALENLGLPPANKLGLKHVDPEGAKSAAERVLDTAAPLSETEDEFQITLSRATIGEALRKLGASTLFTAGVGGITAMAAESLDLADMLQRVDFQSTNAAVMVASILLVFGAGRLSKKSG